MKRFKGFLLVGMIVAMLMQTSVAMAWYKMNIKTGQVVGGNSFAMYGAAVKSPANVHIIYLDPVQTIADSWNDVWFLQDVAYDYTISIPYIPTRRDCDGIACIYKALLAYMGYDNIVGLVIDRTMHHAYNCFWWDKEGTHKRVDLEAIDPQTGKMWHFNGNHDYTIVW